ncbi:MAG TPA: helix-turn-helix domain-containing protein [Solirubrobacteraceae bacterium]
MPTLSRRTASAAEARTRGEAAFLDATSALLEEGHPYGELGIELIAKRAGFSRATFYAYFRDKRELLVRLADRYAGNLYAESGGWLESGDGDLRIILESVLQLFRTHRGVVGALVEASTYDAEIAELWRELHGRFIDLARERIQREHPDLDADDAHARGFALVWMTERACYEHVVAPRVSDQALLNALELEWRTGVERAG